MICQIVSVLTVLVQSGGYACSTTKTSVLCLGLILCPRMHNHHQALVDI